MKSKYLILAALTAAVYSCQKSPAENFTTTPIKATPAFNKVSTKAAAVDGQSVLVGKFSTDLPNTGSLDILAYEEEYVSELRPQTKGAECTADNLSRLYIDAYLDQAVEGLPLHYVEDASIERSGSGVWSEVRSLTSGQPFYWINDVYLHMWAHWFYESELVTGVASTQKPVLEASSDFTVFHVRGYRNGSSSSGESDAVYQKDACLGYKKVKYNGASSSGVDLNLDHALSAIRFNLSSLPDDIAVSKVSLIGVYQGGDCVAEASSSGISFSWTPDGEVDTYSQIYQPYDFESFSTGMDAGLDRTLGRSNKKMFFIMPQTLPLSARMGVTFLMADGTEAYREVCIGEYNSSNVEWKAGKIYTYRFSSSSLENEYFFETNEDSLSVSHMGGMCQCSIKSYYVDAAGNSHPVGWYARSIIGDAIVTGIPGGRRDGSVSGENYDLTVMNNTEYELVSVDNSSEVLSRNEPRGSASAPYDLSTHGINGAETLMNTANCYVINAPGYYSLPLVYGNAIKNGAANTSSYIAPFSNAGYPFLPQFLNHLNAEITDPWINNNGFTVDSAEILWQDSEELITTSSVRVDGNYLEFEIDRNNIHEGNAVITALCNGTVVWSWHIWVTTKDLESELRSTSYNSCTYELLAVPIGWSDAGYCKVFQQKECYVELKQNDSGNTILLKVIQDEYVSNATKGYACYYQWGRKDPIVPANPNMLTQDIPTYPSSVRMGSSSTASIGNAIQTPWIDYHTSSGTWCTNIYDNLWNNIKPNRMYGTITTTVKTIYDPSPVGYCVPAPTAFAEIRTSNQLYYNNNERTYIFSLSDGSTLTIIGCSSRNGTGGGINPYSRVYYFASQATADGYGSSLRFVNDRLIINDNGNYRSCGFPVMPMKEPNT